MSFLNWCKWVPKSVGGKILGSIENFSHQYLDTAFSVPYEAMRFNPGIILFRTVVCMYEEDFINTLHNVREWMFLHSMRYKSSTFVFLYWIAILFYLTCTSNKDAYIALFFFMLLSDLIKSFFTDAISFANIIVYGCLERHQN